MDTKKKLLIFVPKFPVATETFIQREIAELAKRDILDVKVLAIEEGNTKLDRALEGRVFYKSAGVLDIVVSPFKLLFRLLFNNSSVLSVWDVFKDSDITLFKRLDLVLKSVCYYADVIADFNPDFIYSHFLSEPSSVMMGAAIYLDLPFGISAHAKDILVNGQLIKSKVKNAEFINICNVNAWNFCKDAAKPLNSDNVHLRYHGISFDHIENFAPKVNEVPILLNNSRMTPKKGQIYLLQSAKILKEKNRKFLIRIISGGGNLYAELKQYILENDLSDVVDIVNDGKPIFYEEVEKYYKNSDIFVFPSIETTSGDADGVANVLIEAATYRLPIIATDAGSASELVENNRTGLVVPQKDPHALAKAIEFLLDNQLMGQDMAEKAFELVREKFDLSDNVQLIEKDILEHLQ